MNITIETEAYDSTKFGKPWIAKVDWHNPQGNFSWGAFVGEPGEAGVSTITGVNPGDIIARGQKRWGDGVKQTPPTFYQVTNEGTLEPLPSRPAAFKLWNQRNNQQ
jgi:hypothetical protein